MSKYSQETEFTYNLITLSAANKTKRQKTFVNRIEPGIKKSNNLKLRCATSK